MKIINNKPKSELLKKQLENLSEKEFWEIYKFIKMLAKTKIKENKNYKIEFWNDEDLERLWKIWYKSTFFKE